MFCAFYLLPEVLRYLRIAPVLAPDCLVLKAVIGLASRLFGSKPSELKPLWRFSLRLWDKCLAGCSTPSLAFVKFGTHVLEADSQPLL